MADTVDSMRRMRLLGPALAGLLLLSACGGTTSTTDSASASAMDFAGVVPTVAGGQFDLSSIEGQDTVLWFWAPW